MNFISTKCLEKIRHPVIQGAFIMPIFRKGWWKLWEYLVGFLNQGIHPQTGQRVVPTVFSLGRVHPGKG